MNATTSPPRGHCTSGDRDRVLGLHPRKLGQAAGLQVDAAARTGGASLATPVRLEHGRVVRPDPVAIHRLPHTIYAPNPDDITDLDCLLERVPAGHAATGHHGRRGDAQHG
ncbi:hypothetical protein MTQ13_00500 [Streptomyces sp. XM4011]|uniref:hypothetical protein n=1 Tax=Streptomyces sp. XM4011 TaxID=2929780 RepID=UPI001FFAB05E|nr:hypothetical protein [Streptomyces sp. XM4011]MCK1812771.1 hypothetical protein [Streptomyces sp. XM4011]